MMAKRPADRFRTAAEAAAALAPFTEPLATSRVKRRLLVAVALFALLVALAAGVVKIATDRGEVVIETPTPMNRQRAAEVVVLRQGPDGWSTTRHHPPLGWAFFRQAEGFVHTLAGTEGLRAPAETALWDVRVMQRMIEIAEFV